MTSVKLTDRMTAASGDVMAALGTAVGAQPASSDRQSFATVMNDTAQSYKSTEKSGAGVNKSESSGNVQESYQASAQGDAMDHKVSNAVEADSDKFQKFEDNQEELTEDFSQGMKELLTEKLDVSEEDLETAMTALGLNYLDLLNPSNLTQLAAQLTDTEDACALLMNENFTQILQQSELLATELIQTTGISREELLTWMEEQRGDMTVDAENIPDMVQTENPQNAEAASGETWMSEELTREASKMADSQENPGELTGTVQNKEQLVMEGHGEVEPGQMSLEKDYETEDSTQKDDDSAKLTESSIGAEKAVPQEMEASLSGQSENEVFDKDDKEGKEGKPDQLSHSQNAGFENVRTEGVKEIAAPPQTNAANVDVEDLMRQFGEFTRLHVSQDTTSLDMQLNPENLGKLYLHISTGKEGNVTAEIAATSQEVKEALETQIAELRVTLIQQGVKVDAVEVTVASHEFEQNLEQNAARDQQQGEEQEQQNQGRVRSLLRGELDDLSGLASEEEILAAKIMKDNGNSMDVTV